MEGGFRRVVVVTHRGLIAFLVRGRRFGMGEGRGYRFLGEEDDDGEDAGKGEEERRFGVNVDTGMGQDFGPTVLVDVEGESLEGRETRVPIH